MFCGLTLHDNSGTEPAERGRITQLFCHATEVIRVAKTTPQISLVSYWYYNEQLYTTVISRTDKGPVFQRLSVTGWGVAGSW